MGVKLVAADGPVVSADVEEGIAVVDGGIAPADVELAPAGDTLGPANSEAAPAEADRDQPASLVDLAVDSLPRPQTDALAPAQMDPPAPADDNMGVRMVATDGPVASVVVEGGIADSDIEMAVGDVLGPANSEAAPAEADRNQPASLVDLAVDSLPRPQTEAPPADMPRDLAQADRDQPASLQDADMTAAAPNVNVEHQHRDQNASGAVEQVDKDAEAPSGDVDMPLDPVANEGRDGEVGQAGHAVEVTTTDIDMEAGQAAVGVSLEDGQVPQDQLGPSTCICPPVQAADPSL
jgi:hypothetical protein